MFVSLGWLMCAKNVVILDKIFVLDLICSLCLKIESDVIVARPVWQG